MADFENGVTDTDAQEGASLIRNFDPRKVAANDAT